MRKPVFTPEAWEEFMEWSKEDLKILKKILELIDDASGNPFSGIGKPEPLKHNLKGCWSRRITHEHRLVYQVTDDSLIIIKCKYHY
ncbi:Txe/YoeB family addiction module toxin [Runella sp.]|uniref:Txe/YoeB family addiction module toxin n=1 Tax=Runella sp. TaxID=1960881 RepID=UPI003D09E26B